MSLTDFLSPATTDDDPRSQQARELLDVGASAAMVYKTTRAGATTSFCAEILRRGETFTIVEPTNRINSDTLEKAAALSGTDKAIIPILSNTNCILNKELIERYPEIEKLGILPLQQCEDKDGVKCGFYDECPITLPLRQVSDVGGYAITYSKLVALYLSKGNIAEAILSIVMGTDHLILDEAHAIAYPNTVAVQVHPEIDLSKYDDLDFSVLADAVRGFTDVSANAADAIERIKKDAQNYTKKHLAHQITMDDPILVKSKYIAAGMNSLVDLMIDRRDYNLTSDDVVVLRDMLFLCAERNHVVHGIIDTKPDGGKKLRILIETTDAVFKSTIWCTIKRYLEPQEYLGTSYRQGSVWLTSGTMPDMDAVLPFDTTPLMFGDPLDTNSMFAVIADRREVSNRTLNESKTDQFNRIINDIRHIVDRFGDENCVVCVMNKKWHCRVEDELKDYESLIITWYVSDKTIGVESDHRIWIAVGRAEKPKNAYDALALSRMNSDDDLVVMSDKLRNERVHIDTWQAWSRAKDPEGEDRSVVVALGCNAEDVENVTTWYVNRKLDQSRVTERGGGSRRHYDVVGDELIGSEIPTIQRGRNDDINELIEKWLDTGDTMPLTMKSLKNYLEKHKDKEHTFRDIYRGMHLDRKGLKQKDVKQILSDNGHSVTKVSYYNIIGINGDKTVTKVSHNTPPLTKQDILNHYRQPLVADTILQHSSIGSSWRCGNIDSWGWWKKINIKGDVLQKLCVLPDPDDYELLIKNGRTLYWSLNFFEESIKTQHRHKDSGTVIGDYSTTMAYSLGVDIDHANDTNVFEAKEALEAATAFFIAKLHDIGIHHSYDVLFSGGGVYILIHPAITVCQSEKRTDREHWFYLLAESYNIFINEVQQKFYETYPEYKSFVKFDALNNSKRIFKTLFSIHKNLPFSCIPLDKTNPQIDFVAAHPPLSDDVLKSGSDWLSDHDINEQQALINALSQYEDQIKEKHPAQHIDTEITISDTPVEIENFPPCINTILNTHHPPSGSTRMVAFLSAHLGQCGWDRPKALTLVLKTADQLGMGRNTTKKVFGSWFGKMHCPNCDTIQTTGTHYPAMNMGELNVCNPDNECDYIYNPTKYKQHDENIEVEI